jgi:hypothetical protein
MRPPRNHARPLGTLGVGLALGVSLAGCDEDKTSTTPTTDSSTTQEQGAPRALQLDKHTGSTTCWFRGAIETGHTMEDTRKWDDSYTTREQDDSYICFTSDNRFVWNFTPNNNSENWTAGQDPEFRTGTWSERDDHTSDHFTNEYTITIDGRDPVVVTITGDGRLFVPAGADDENSETYVIHHSPCPDPEACLATYQEPGPGPLHD